VVIRRPPRLLPLAAGVAVAQTVGDGAGLKWPNDVVLGDRKIAGILVEGRPQQRWAVLGIGLNVALRESDFPAELRARAATMGLEPSAVEPTLQRLLVALHRWLPADDGDVLAAVRERDALRGRQLSWADGTGRADGIDDDGRLIVFGTDGGIVLLDAGEVHLTDPDRP
jgi:BirA family biotin operon repressor/biotin-[acetyl-CoA-carboxylase] ligase